MVANPNVPIIVGSLCNLTPSSCLSRALLVKDRSWFLQIISGKRFDLGWSWPPLADAMT
jgi:hypothetical protein